MKATKHLLIIIMIFGLAISLFACKESTPTVQKEAKPAFNAALTNYETLENKGSDFEAKFIVTLYGKVTEAEDGTQNQTKFTVGQHIQLNRIKNGKKIYIAGELGSCDVSSDVSMLISSVSGFSKSNSDKPDDNDKKDDDITLLKKYLDGEILVNFKIGYDGNGNYNAKVAIKNDTIDEHRWIGTNQDNINKFLDYIKFENTINLSQYLMFSTYINPDEKSWIDKDSASMFWCDSLDAYNYEMQINDDQLIDSIFSVIDKYVGYFDNTEYATEIEKYNKYIGYLHNWISIGDNGIAATVNENGLPIDMTTSATLYANIDIKELKTIIGDTMSEDDADTANSFINFASLLLLRGINGEKDKFGISFQIILDEKYLYNDADISLKDIDEDMFADCSEDIADRDYTFLFDKEDWK
ncbi:MAG: hypothetical protein WCR54_06455 [Clostridia bacterium]